jgi:LacI family transcriptional regulator, galactose operon repressor
MTAAKRSRVTLADVARQARVDPSVVSRVINGDSRLVIKAETRERVLATIRELNYHPNAAARSLRTAQSGTFGLLIPDFTNPIYAEIIKGAEQEATEHGSLLLAGTAFDDRPERYVEMLASGRVEGLLLAANRLPTDAVQAMLATGRSIVSVNQRIRGIEHAILADDERASKIAVQHFVGLGHERIAHLRGPADSDTARRRLNGFRRAMRAAGFPPDPDLIVGTDYTTDAGAGALRELMSRRPRPTAVLVANVAAAVGALSAARELDVHVPDDLSVVAIHDIPLAANLWPPLTTVRMPLGEMGRAGVRALVSDPGPAEIVVVRDPTELIERESTAPPSRRRP